MCDLVKFFEKRFLRSKSVLRFFIGNNFRVDAALKVNWKLRDKKKWVHHYFRVKVHPVLPSQIL